jgi:hypothetical protein
MVTIRDRVVLRDGDLGLVTIRDRVGPDRVDLGLDRVGLDAGN